MKLNLNETLKEAHIQRILEENDKAADGAIQSITSCSSEFLKQCLQGIQKQN
jgi:hypothetical protein